MECASLHCQSHCYGTATVTNIALPLALPRHCHCHYCGTATTTTTEVTVLLSSHSHHHGPATTIVLPLPLPWHCHYVRPVGRGLDIGHSQQPFLRLIWGKILQNYTKIRQIRNGNISKEATQLRAPPATKTAHKTPNRKQHDNHQVHTYFITDNIWIHTTPL